MLNATNGRANINMTTCSLRVHNPDTNLIPMEARNRKIFSTYNDEWAKVETFLMPDRKVWTLSSGAWGRGRCIILHVSASRDTESMRFGFDRQLFSKSLRHFTTWKLKTIWSARLLEFQSFLSKSLPLHLSNRFRLDMQNEVCELRNSHLIIRVDHNEEIYVREIWDEPAKPHTSFRRNKFCDTYDLRSSARSRTFLLPRLRKRLDLREVSSRHLNCYCCGHDDARQ